MTKPKVLLWDVETSLMKVLTFGLKTKYINPEFITEDWHIISAAYKFLDEDKVHLLKNTKGKNDKEIVKKLAEVLASADVVVHHNGDKFDVKKLHTRMIKHSIAPHYIKLRTVDTLKEARKHFAFSSNSLDYLGKFLNVGAKSPHTRDMWIKEAAGNKKAVHDIAKYNITDVMPLLQGVYLKLAPYIDHPKPGNVDHEICPNSACGSSRTKRRGYETTRGGVKKRRHSCSDCGHWFYSKM